MQYFRTYSSNTLAASANQHVFHMEPQEVRTGRIFYRITNGGHWKYALLFSNITDSTYADGSKSHRNLICNTWNILSARVGKCNRQILDADFFSPECAERINQNVFGFVPLTFHGKESKSVAPGEFFHCDPFPYAFDSGDYLCLEITYSGQTIPYHEETLLPVFRKTASGWVYHKQMPVPGMIGCDRSVKGRIAYLGDSITQGIGAPYNSYQHWCALVSQKLSGEYAYWNLGIGYARANDAASDGAWLYKVKQNDVVFVCMGVNDIYHIGSAEQLIQDLNRIVDLLTHRGIRIILQTVPPFDYDPAHIKIWNQVNIHIQETLKKRVDLVFDTVPVLQQDAAHPQNAKYGGHPNVEGSTLWADALFEAITRQKIL